MKYEDLSPRTRDQADAIDKDEIEWNKAIQQTLEDLIKMELENGVPLEEVRRRLGYKSTRSMRSYCD